MNKETQLWYIKVKGQVKGPYTTGLISKDILLGRIHPSDLLSRDKELWHKASTIREVMPDVVKHRNEPNYKERIRAAKRWADERDTIREVDQNGINKRHTTRKRVTHLGIKTTGITGIIAVAIIVSGFIYAMFRFTPDDPLAKINCSAPAGAGVIYDTCHLQRKLFNKKNLQGSSFKNSLLQNSQFKQANLQNSNLDYANLSHADLTQANFTGASLRATDFRGATLNATIFTNADLSYADLSNAKASALKLTGARLSNTIWFDGTVCNKESLGQCIR